MNKLENVLYTAKAHTTAGRDGGASQTGDGKLQFTLTAPSTAGTGTNPEQLFAAAWFACYLSAIKYVGGKRKLVLPDDLAIDTEIDVGLAHGLHNLAARLKVSLPRMDEETAQWLVTTASHVCPYSLATSGNIDVQYIPMTAERGMHA